MLRLSHRTTVSATILALTAVVVFPSSVNAQQVPPRTPDAQQSALPRQAVAPQQQVSRELWQLLSDWAEGSANVKYLHGKHERRAYEHTFGVEKISYGEFWYAAPDKGRIDVKAVRITPQMVADRDKPDANVEKKDGKPYVLKSDDPKRWICDGQNLFDIDDQRMEAQVAPLPPGIRGANIMDSPLPFLFGLPPDKAVARFSTTILKDYRPKYAVVLLEVLPRTRADAENWSKAKVYLDTNRWLPTAVQLVNPAETKDTRYTFRDIEVNEPSFLKKLILGDKIWEPKLDAKKYSIHVLQPGKVVPNVAQQAHNIAADMLVEAGVDARNISRQNAGPAPEQRLTYRVLSQSPRPGTPITPDLKVVLKIYDKPKRQ